MATHIFLQETTFYKEIQNLERLGLRDSRG